MNLSSKGWPCRPEGLRRAEASGASQATQIDLAEAAPLSEAERGLVAEVLAALNLSAVRRGAAPRWRLADPSAHVGLEREVQGHSAASGDGLRTAADALDALAAGQVPERADALTGALALQTQCLHAPAPSRDLLDAAAGLETLATGGTLDLDALGRERAARLAALVRQLVPAWQS